jgi:hypothetical protein
VCVYLNRDLIKFEFNRALTRKYKFDGHNDVVNYLLAFLF